MAVNYGTSIVTSGLTMLVDAANPRSYPGTGTVWSDISGNGIAGTLVASPTYSANNRGYFTFNGTSQYCQLPLVSPLLLAGKNFSMDCWVYLTAYSQVFTGVYSSALFSNLGFQWTISGTATSFVGLSISANSGAVSNTVQYAFALNTWYNCAMTYQTSGGVWIMYVNGMAAGSFAAVAGAWSETSAYSIGRYQLAGSEYYFPGYIANYKVYNNTILTATQLSQNFNAYRGRYGATNSFTPGPVTNYGGLVISYSLGTAGAAGSGAFDGTTGGTTTATFNGTTLSATGGAGGVFNALTAAAGGTGTGGDGSASGGTGAGATGDAGGGSGGATGTVNGTRVGGSAGDPGAQAADISGLQTALTGLSLAITAGGSAGPAGTAGSPNINNGGNATGFGSGGGSAGYYGGNGGNGLYGGGGGGASGYTAIQTGGTGGQGVVIVQLLTGTYQYVLLSSGTSYTIPSNTTSVKIWAVGAGGGGSGTAANDLTSGGGGGAGGVSYKLWS